MDLKYIFIAPLIIVVLLAFHDCGALCNRPLSSKEEKCVPSELTPDQMRQDLDYLIKTVFSSHPNPYAYMGSQEFEMRKNEAYSAIRQARTIDEFFVISQHLITALKNGHTSLGIPSGWASRFSEGKVFPILLKVVDKKVYLFQNFGDEQLPIGSEIISINDEPALSVAQDMASYFPREGRCWNYGRLESVRFMFYMMAIKFKGATNISVKMKNNSQTNDYRIATIPSEKANEKTRTFCTQGDQKRYNGFLNYDFIEKYNTGLITVNCFIDKQNFEKRISDYFKKMNIQHINNLIIDLRNCPGGNSGIGDVLLDYIADKPWRQTEKFEVKYSKLYIDQNFAKNIFLPLCRLFKVNSVEQNTCSFNYPNNSNPDRFKGKVYLLIGPNTYSAAVDFAAAVKYYHFGILIGEETGDNLIGYGDALNFTLPNSGLCGTVACKYFMHVSSDINFGQGVLPDYKVYDTNANEDTTLEFTLKQIGRNTSSHN